MLMYKGVGAFLFEVSLGAFAALPGPFQETEGARVE